MRVGARSPPCSAFNNNALATVFHRSDCCSAFGRLATKVAASFKLRIGCCRFWIKTGASNRRDQLSGSGAVFETLSICDLRSKRATHRPLGGKSCGVSCAGRSGASDPGMTHVRPKGSVLMSVPDLLRAVGPALWALIWHRRRRCQIATATAYTTTDQAPPLSTRSKRHAGHFNNEDA
jgi:hypothetical protein